MDDYPIWLKNVTTMPPTDFDELAYVVQRMSVNVAKYIDLNHILGDKRQMHKIVLETYLGYCDKLVDFSRLVAREGEPLAQIIKTVRRSRKLLAAM